MERRQFLKNLESIHFYLRANLFPLLPISLVYLAVQVARPSNTEVFGKPNTVAKDLTEFSQPSQTRSSGILECYHFMLVQRYTKETSRWVVPSIERLVDPKQ